MWHDAFFLICFVGTLVGRELYTRTEIGLSQTLSKQYQYFKHVMRSNMLIHAFNAQLPQPSIQKLTLFLLLYNKVLL